MKTGEKSYICPTCGAVQEWRDECRRCRTDISQLRRLSEETSRLRQCIIEALRAGDGERASVTAARLNRIKPTQENEILHRFASDCKQRSASP